MFWDFDSGVTADYWLAKRLSVETFWKLIREYWEWHWAEPDFILGQQNKNVVWKTYGDDSMISLKALWIVTRYSGKIV